MQSIVTCGTARVLLLSYRAEPKLKQTQKKWARYSLKSRHSIGMEVEEQMTTVASAGMPDQLANIFSVGPEQKIASKLSDRAVVFG